MKNKSILLAITAAILLAIFIIIVVTDKKDLESNSDLISSSSTSSKGEIVGPEKTAFEEIIFDTEPTMYGKTDYFSIQSGIDIKEMNMDYLKLEPLLDETGNPIKYYLGHQIYKSQENGEEYIISGNAILPISFVADYEGNGYLREEGTGKKIHMFGNMSDLENFQDNWDAGQRILSGKTIAPENAIIFDGSLTPYTFTRQNGTIYFDLSEIAPLASEFTCYEETMGYIDVYVNDFSIVRIPTTAVNPMMSESLGVLGNSFRFSSWNGEKFTTWATVLDAIKPEISIEEASMMFGWKMYTNGTALSIVTDPLNATPLAAIRESGNTGIKVVIETSDDGNRYIRAYDSSGNIMWEKPFDESAVPEEGKISLDGESSSKNAADSAASNNVVYGSETNIEDENK